MSRPWLPGLRQQAAMRYTPSYRTGVSGAGAYAERFSCGEDKETADETRCEHRVVC